MNHEKPFIALSLDGGGFRGLYTAALLQRLSTLFTKKEINIGSKFSLIAGTSTGGILACSLAKGIPLSQIVDFYKQKGESIFSRPKPTSKLGVLCWALRRTPSCNQDKLAEALKEVFGDMTIGEVYEKEKIALCLPTVNLANNHPVVLKTPHNQGKTLNDNISLVDACLATSAAPIFFPAARIKNWAGTSSDRLFVDGGLWANNPVIIALTEALTLAPNKNIVILSIGTASTPGGNLNDKQNLSALDWGFGSTVVESAIDSQSIGFNFTANLLKKALSSPERTIDIIRLPEIHKSVEYHEAVKLDRANPRAIRILLEAANADAENIHSLFHQGDSDLQHLELIFSNNN